MRTLTRKLSGPAKERFFRRFFAEQSGVDAALAAALARRSAAVFTSVRVRRDAVAVRTFGARGARADSGPLETAAVAPSSAPEVPASGSPPASATAAFDAYAFGLVPVFQREGRDGLMARLAGVSESAHLRQMARAQQISLPQELRTGDVSADALREAIVDAVAKRIADRRAAASGPG